MIQKNKYNFYTSSLLTTIGIFHGFSDRHAGDVLKQSQREVLLQNMGIAAGRTISCEQVHGGIVRVVGGSDIGTEVAACDGLVYKDDHHYPIALRLRVADCVPIIAVDPTVKVVGVAHAGWKGTVAGIAKTLIQTMLPLGAQTNNIYVGMGPHIGMCCYTIQEDRVRMVRAQCGQSKKILARQAGQWHADLGYANYQALQEVGIAKNHIDWALMCTSCQVSEFFSFRKDTKETFGEQVAIVGFTS